MRMFATVAASILIGTLPATAQTAKTPHYPVLEVPERDDALAIVDTIGFRTPLSFERVLTQVENPRFLFLNSPGGNVSSALAIASRVNSLGLVTVVPEGAKCFSACSLIFFSGAQRIAIGDLGVHQIRAAEGEGNLSSGQFAIADIIEVLDGFDVPAEVLTIMFRTPAEEMYVFSPEENRRFGFLEDEPRRSTTAPDKMPNPSIEPHKREGRELLGSYVALLSANDRTNSSGAPLTAAAGVIQQDRANVHRFNSADREDEPDGFFRTRDQRSKIPQLIEAGELPGLLARRAVTENVRVKVEIYGRSGVPEALYVRELR